MKTPIQLDAAYAYQQAVLTVTRHTLCQTHGEAFAAHFIDEFKGQVLQAARTRLCGLSEAAVWSEALRLRNADHIA